MKRLTSKHLKQLCKPAQTPSRKKPAKTTIISQGKIQTLLTPGLGLGMGTS